MEPITRVLSVSHSPLDFIEGMGGLASYFGYEAYPFIKFHSVITEQLGNTGSSFYSQCAKAHDILGIDHSTIASLFIPAGVHQLHLLVERFQPQVIFTHFPVDMKPRRGLVALHAQVASQELEHPADLYFYELPSTYHEKETLFFLPTHYTDIEKTLLRKLDAHTLYCPEIDRLRLQGCSFSHNHRGRECNVHFAEAFLRIGSTIEPHPIPHLTISTS